jgi:hypothetical protein
MAWLSTHLVKKLSNIKVLLEGKEESPKRREKSEPE